MYLIDTDILIDYLRLHQPAIKLLEKFPLRHRKISAISQLELIQGCKTKEEEKKINHFLKHFKILPITKSITKMTIHIYQEHKWTKHMEIPDSFIAATALKTTSTLLSRNTKHYTGIHRLKVESPY